MTVITKQILSANTKTMINEKTQSEQETSTKQESVEGCSGATRSVLSFSIVMPDGSKIHGLTRKEAGDCLIWAPWNSYIDPPIPCANNTALNLLDFLCK